MSITAISISDDLAAATALPLEAWARRGWTGRGVRVALLDSGVNATRDELGDRIAASLVTDRSGRPPENAAMTDETGHGTAIAVTVARIAPDAALLPARVIEGGATVWRLLVGLDWALAQRADLVLMPLGLRGDGLALRPVLQSVLAAGTLPIASIGNAGAGRVTVPGALPEVLSVGACDGRHRPAPFSGSSRAGADPVQPDVLAPGVRIPCPGADGETEPRSGTSMAAAVATGTLAVLSGALGLASNALAAAVRAGALPLGPDFAHRARFGVMPTNVAGNADVFDPPPIGPGTLCPALTLRCRRADPEALLDVVATAAPSVLEPAFGARVTARLPRLGAYRLTLTPPDLLDLHARFPAVFFASANPLTG